MRTRWLLAAFAATTLFGARVRAQTAEKRTLTLDGARRAVAAAVSEANRRKVGAVIAVADDGGNLMALERVDGTFAAGARVSAGKARTAVLFKKPTRFFEELINKGRTAMTAVEDFTPLIGGIPIVVDGQVVGGIGVSGASSAKEDEELALVGAAALIITPTSAAPVTQVPHDRVSAAFTHGASLVALDNYRVEASHREGAGQAEVHTRETDIIYVLDGVATLVTGGSVVDAKATAQDELRGAAIRGGEAHRLGKGDVIVVPKGVPHWFQDVPGPINYYVVKVRS
jgi:glc operon protein GlcG